MSSSTLDITQVGASTFGPNGSVLYNVAPGGTLNYPGEPVARALGAVTVTAMANNKPVVGSDYLVGIATTTSTNTASAAGHVYVQPINPGQIWAINPKVAATWSTQADYDALSGKRVLLDLTSGAYTILASDSVNNGCVIMPKNISDDSGKIYFSFRGPVADLAN